MLGSHTISATVTDSGGKINTVSRAMDVADPNLNRNSINPVSPEIYSVDNLVKSLFSDRECVKILELLWQEKLMLNKIAPF